MGWQDDQVLKPQQAGPVFGPPPKAPAPMDPLEAQYKVGQIGAQGRDANADALAQRKTQLEIDKMEAEARNGPPLDENAQKAASTRGNLDAVITQINKIQGLYDNGLRDETISNLFGAGDLFNTPSNAGFDSSAAGLADMGTAAFKVPGMGPQSDADAARFVAANQPAASDWDQRIEAKLDNLRTRVDANRAALGLPPAEWAGLAPQDDQRAVAAIGGPNPPMNGAEAGNVPGGDGGGVTILEGDTRTVADPTMAGLVSAYRGQLANSPSPGALVKWLSEQGITEPAILRQAVQQAKYRQRFPQVPLDQYSISATTEEPVSVTDQFISSAPGAFMGSAVNFTTGNSLDSLAGMVGGDAEQVRGNLDVASAAYPTASALGSVAGGVMASMGGEALLARAGMAPGFVRGLVADTGFGAASGAGAADDGSRLSGLVTGAASSAAGSAGGQALARGAGAAISPTGGSLADLYASGVRPTLGQRVANANDGKGFTGMVGKAVNATEEALQSVPIVGSAIRGARQEARDQFQVGAFNEALKEVGETLPKGMGPGTDPHKVAQATFNRVYDQARSGMRMVADQELSNDLSGLAPDIATLGPQAQNKLKAIIANSVNSKLSGGEMAGDGYKRAVADLGKHISRLGRSAMGEDQALAEVLTGVKGAIDSAARRHSPPEAVELLDAADAGYAKLVRIEEAASKRGGDQGTFSPAQFDSAVQKTSGGVRSKAYLRGDALMEDYASAGRSLEDRMPNSGTTDRALLAGGAAGAVGYLEPTTLGVLGAIGAAYAPGVRRVTKGAMAPGGVRSKAIADQLRKRARIAGAVGGASAAAALPGTAQSQ